MCSTSHVSTFLSGAQLSILYFLNQYTQHLSPCFNNLTVAYVCVVVESYTTERLACSMIQKEQVQNLSEVAYSTTLAQLKTPLLLARSEMQSLDHSSRADQSRVFMAAHRRIEELWHMLTNLPVDQSSQPLILNQKAVPKNYPDVVPDVPAPTSHHGLEKSGAPSAMSLPTELPARHLPHGRIVAPFSSEECSTCPRNIKGSLLTNNVVAVAEEMASI